MSITGGGKPFYVDYGTSVVAIRCSSNHDVLFRWDTDTYRDWRIERAESICDRMNKEVYGHEAGNTNAMRKTLELCSKYMNEAVADKDFGDDVLFLVGCMKMCIAMMRHAMVEPSRNCDTAESAEEITRRFRSEVCDHYDNDWEDPRTQCPHNCAECVVKWMISKKGEESSDMIIGCNSKDAIRRDSEIGSGKECKR